jgi:hypothetical protein
LGIHAGSKVDEEGMDLYSHLLDHDLPLGALVGSVRMVDCVEHCPSSTLRKKNCLPLHRDMIQRATMMRVRA